MIPLQIESSARLAGGGRSSAWRMPAMHVLSALLFTIATTCFEDLPSQLRGEMSIQAQPECSPQNNTAAIGDYCVTKGLFYGVPVLDAFTLEPHTPWWSWFSAMFIYNAVIVVFCLTSERWMSLLGLLEVGDQFLWAGMLLTFFRINIELTVWIHLGVMVIFQLGSAYELTVWDPSYLEQIRTDFKTGDIKIASDDTVKAQNVYQNMGQGWPHCVGIFLLQTALTVSFLYELTQQDLDDVDWRIYWGFGVLCSFSSRDTVRGDNEGAHEIWISLRNKIDVGREFEPVGMFVPFLNKVFVKKDVQVSESLESGIQVSESRWEIKIAGTVMKLEFGARVFMSEVVNRAYAMTIIACIPLFLSIQEGWFDIVKDALALLFIMQLDNINDQTIVMK